MDEGRRATMAARLDRATKALTDQFDTLEPYNPTGPAMPEMRELAAAVLAEADRFYAAQAREWAADLRRCMGYNDGDDVIPKDRMWEFAAEMFDGFAEAPWEPIDPSPPTKES